MVLVFSYLNNNYKYSNAIAFLNNQLFIYKEKYVNYYLKKFFSVISDVIEVFQIR